MTRWPEFRDRRTLRQIGGCREVGTAWTLDGERIKRAVLLLAGLRQGAVYCSCGRSVPAWRYGLHRRLSGPRHYLRQVTWSLWHRLTWRRKVARAGRPAGGGAGQ